MPARWVCVCITTVLLSAAMLNADTIPGGYVSGTWLADSTYWITGDITVPIDSTLTIEPGVQVIFCGPYRLTVSGQLQATGTETDSIDFVPADTLTPWRGIFFNGSNNGLSYCNIRYVELTTGWGAAIECNNSISTISHCTISDNYGRSGGISARDYSSLTVSSCTIIRNRAITYGGGIYIRQYSSLDISNSLIDTNAAISTPYGGGGIYVDSLCSLVVSNCTISNNTAMYTSDPSGGGIAARVSNVSISGSVFMNNTADWDGGGIWLASCQGSIADCYFGENTVGSNRGHGIYITNSSPLISHCVFSDNGFIGGIGGGIYVGDNSNPTIDHCDFFRNYSGTQTGGGIHISSLGSMTLSNTIFQENAWYNVYFASGSSSAISYNDFLLLSGLANFGGTVPSGLGVLTQTNINGDSCDADFNIFLDPMFENPLSGNFNLQSQSPCIDAGDPLYPLDPDSTITDMGAFYFDQVGIEEVSIARSASCYGLSCSPNPCNTVTRISFGLLEAARINLSIYDIAGRLVTTLIDGKYEPGIHELTFDTEALATGIYFNRLTSSGETQTGKLVLMK
ncbi:MAG: right-handed parallel beta-helix repeat-containing protein [bacterium]